MTKLIKTLERVRESARTLELLDENKIRFVLEDLARALIIGKEDIIKANARDIKKMSSRHPMYDRLLLTETRLEAMAADIKKIANLPSPINQVLEEKTLSNGLKLTKVSVPLGVVGIIYEARPNVTVDTFVLCFKSHNACILKGGSEAFYSNTALVNVISKALARNGVDKNVVHLLPPSRSAVGEMLKANEYIDVIIPRGGEELIKFVRNNSRIPVIETGAGVVHTYFDESGDLLIGKKIIENAKTRRPGVCNALDTLIIHKNRLADLPELLRPLLQHNVEVYADSPSFNVLKGKYNGKLLRQAKPQNYGVEFLSLKMSIKTVDGLDGALGHIAKYSSRHSEAIISHDEKNIERFTRNIDSAVVYANTSTAFTDGGEFGMGAEIGISTQKLHARGPMGLKELTSYKWIVQGSGQVRHT
ncbi:glutamate-5-semialdehyde dehydrogenase [Candidatus Peregrinibacteria bacterium]|nr:glutamate-5-semialdehyde dehydrogenase [Candidatus Peregrinibacteria bacterium]